MATFTKMILSGSTDGKGVKVVATATTGTTIHTASSTAADIDEVWLYAVNASASLVKLTVEFGGTTSPDDLIEVHIPSEEGLFLVAPGLTLKGNATPKVITAFAATANVVIIHGFVNRIS